MEARRRWSLRRGNNLIYVDIAVEALRRDTQFANRTTPSIEMMVQQLDKVMEVYKYVRTTANN